MPQTQLQQTETAAAPRSHGYPEIYKGPKPIKWQILKVAKTFKIKPNGALKFAESVRELPEGAEGLFAIPRWQAIAPICEVYEEALRIILYDFYGRQIDPQRFLCSADTIEMLQQLSDQQNSDILVIGGQLGKRYAGRSISDAREAIAPPEFPLDALSVAVILGMHPERFGDFDDLWIDCPGTEFSGFGNQFDHSLYFRFRNGRVVVDTRSIKQALTICGSGSGFILQ